MTSRTTGFAAETGGGAETSCANVAVPELNAANVANIADRTCFRDLAGWLGFMVEALSLEVFPERQSGGTA
jgi:hypothetical protein